MQKIELNDPETMSTDIVAENVDALKALFPEAFKEGRIDFEVLKQLLGGVVDERDEKYGLNWNGKRKARQIALTPSTGTLLPCPEESVDWDTTQNLMIEGDNLEVLKLLQKSYAGRVTTIYIDPPYNTGNDFIYPDDFRDSLKNYQAITGQIDDVGNRISTNSEVGGRFHSNWLDMMYPRLRLARTMLSEFGSIFISVDDNELQNVRCMCDEIFGSENFIAVLIWQKVFSPKNSAVHFSVDHDYIVVYAKNAEIWRPKLLPRTPEMEARYNNRDNDPRGPWTSGDLSARNYYGEGTYAVTTPSGREIPRPPPGRYWAISKENFLRLDNDGRIWWGESGDNMPRLKRFLSEVQEGKTPQTIWFHSDVGNTQESKRELLELLPFTRSDDVFETPKPTRLIKKILSITNNAVEQNIVLDFFAGSGTTGHAVWLQNQEDDANRRFILVQLPEKLESAAMLKDGKTISDIADITRERLARAGEKLKKESAKSGDDYGFRVFKLDSSNIRAWEPMPEDIVGTLLRDAEHLVSGRSEQDVLYEMLLKLGLDLCVPIEERKIAGKNTFSVGGGALFVCLADNLTKEAIETLAAGIVAWRSELAPAVETRVVFKDSGFADDVAKANMAAILNQNGILDVRSL